MDKEQRSKTICKPYLICHVFWNTLYIEIIVFRRRALDLFEALDIDNSGTIDSDEFLEG